MSKVWTLKELEQQSCSSFGGNNCAMHGCMFNCQLREAKIRAIVREQGVSEEQAKNILDKK